MQIATYLSYPYDIFERWVGYVQIFPSPCLLELLYLSPQGGFSMATPKLIRGCRCCWIHFVFYICIFFQKRMIQRYTSGIRRSHSIDKLKFKSKLPQCSPKDWPEPSK